MHFIAGQLLQKSETKHLAKIFNALNNERNGVLCKQDILNSFKTSFNDTLDPELVDLIFSRVPYDAEGQALDHITFHKFVLAAVD